MAGDPAGSLKIESPVLVNAVQYAQTTTGFTLDTQLPYKVETLTWKLTCFKEILKELNDSEQHCITVIDGECELDYLQW